jgi:Arc/MetJ-type ribon-helix-helix transcriptional regulator
MTIHLPEHLERYLHDQVVAGRFRSEDDVILAALEQHRQSQQPSAAPPSHSDEPSSLEMQRRLFDAGIIAEVRPPITDLTPYQERIAGPFRSEGNLSLKPSSVSVASRAAFFLDSSAVVKRFLSFKGRPLYFREESAAPEFADPVSFSAIL